MKNFAQYENLIYKIAWKIADHYPVQVDDAIQEGVILAMEAEKTHDPDKASLCTWINSHVNHGLRLWAKREVRRISQETENTNLDEMGSSSVSPETYIMFKEKFRRLGQDAQTIANLVLECPADLFSLISGKPPRKIKGELWKYAMDKLGMSRYRVRNGLQELKQEFS